MRVSARIAAAVAAAGALLAACSVGDVMRPDIDIVRTSALVAPAPLRRLEPSVPYLDRQPDYQEVDPFHAPPPQPAVMPQDEQECRRELRRLGATFRDLPTIDDGGGCGIEWPVELTALSGNIQMKPAATLTCRMAVAVARWSENELGPAARWRYMSGVKAIHQGSSYSCRRIRGSRTMSEHAKGNALDVMRIELDSGKKIGVRKPGFFRFREKSLLKNVRADACEYFSTVLGPGYDRDHKDHFHFDLAERRNGYKACR